MMHVLMVLLKDRTFIRMGGANQSIKSNVNESIFDYISEPHIF